MKVSSGAAFTWGGGVAVAIGVTVSSGGGSRVKVSSGDIGSGVLPGGPGGFRGFFGAMRAWIDGSGWVDGDRVRYAASRPGSWGCSSSHLASGVSLLAKDEGHGFDEASDSRSKSPQSLLVEWERHASIIDAWTAAS